MQLPELFPVFPLDTVDRWGFGTCAQYPAPPAASSSARGRDAGAT